MNEPSKETILSGWPGSFLVHDRKGENVRTSGLLADNANADNGDTRFHARFIAPPRMRVKRDGGGVAEKPHKELVKHGHQNWLELS